MVETIEAGWMCYVRDLTVTSSSNFGQMMQAQERTTVEVKQKMPLKEVDSIITRVHHQKKERGSKAAVALCRNGISKYPENITLRRLMFDLLFDEKDYQSAFVALGDYIACIGPNRTLIADFAKRYRRFRRVLSKDEMRHYAQTLKTAISEGHTNKQVRIQVREVISEDLPRNTEHLGETEEYIIKYLQNDSTFESFVQIERTIEDSEGIERIAPLLDKYILNRPRSLKTFRIDLYCVSIYEKLSAFENASKILSELLQKRMDSVAIRSLFRISRLRKDYGLVDELLTNNPEITKTSDFNILYELVYYFESKNDFDAIQTVLRRIDRGFDSNLPVKRTVRNFYIRFGMPQDAKRLDGEISNLYAKQNRGEEGKYKDAVTESEMEVASKVQDLYSQLEHQKKLAAISDLTTGISHELGQPITNIRYTIQFYKRIFEKGISKTDIDKVFSSILEETARMGGLIRRLAPLTSSRSVTESFDVMERIRRRVDAELPKLTENQIEVTIHPKGPVRFYADPVKFDQLISNLLLNAMDAISEKGPRNPSTQRDHIEIQIESTPTELKLLFSDTGIGIPIANRNKIFDPFFSTKPPGKGEGLGLFIVWNILKMLGGRISVDPNYSTGARFISIIPKIAE